MERWHWGQSRLWVPISGEVWAVHPFHVQPQTSLCSWWVSMRAGGLHYAWKVLCASSAFTLFLPSYHMSVYIFR